MVIRFWGVRGSLATPLSSSAVQAKITAILDQVVPEDLANAESRKRFLDGLPPWLYGTVGGNSPCVSVDIEGFNEPFIFDCGSGLRDMGMHCNTRNPAPSRYHIFFSHFHWDHLQGLPFFGPAYGPVAIDFYSPKQELQEALVGQMLLPYFPIGLENMRSNKKFCLLEKPVTIGPVSIAFKKMNHPGDSYAYKLTYNGRQFIYATDVELVTADFMETDENIDFFRDADIIILDSQYTLGEAIEKYNWGHSAFSISVDFAAHWGIKHLVLFHHDPNYDDEKLYGILQSARWYLQKMNRGLEVSLATDGLEISL
ncbi:MAG: MBL fold metallo-hydrolase [Treponema sp.]|nr:MBL fold metallo-hydrolase [Treponema sp.]